MENNNKNMVDAKPSNPTQPPQHILHAVDLTHNEQTDLPKVRCFYMLDSKVIFGVNLVETEDSFLVGAPSRLVRKDEHSEVEVEHLYKTAVLRLMKSSLALVTIPNLDLMSIYMRFLAGVGSALLPDYMTDVRVAAALEVASRGSIATREVEVKGETSMDYGSMESGSWVKPLTHPGSALVH